MGHPDKVADQISDAILDAILAQDPKARVACDQGLMFGYAANETPEYMPLPIHLAHRIVEKLAELRQSGKIPWLRPDGKSQVTVGYEDERPVGIHTVVVSTQHDESVLDKN